MGPSIQSPKALGVSASDTVDIHLQDQLKPWPQQGKHLFPVPVGLIRIRSQLTRTPGGRNGASSRLMVGGWQGVGQKAAMLPPQQTNSSKGQQYQVRRRPRVRTELHEIKSSRTRNQGPELSDLSRAGTSLFAAMLRNRRTMWIQRKTAMAS